MQFAYVPIGVPTYDLEAAGKQFELSCKLIHDCYGDEAVCPSSILLSVSELRKYLSKLNPDLIILQNTTFANAAYCSEVVAAFQNVPLLLWTLREPVIDGKRLRMNSLTGSYSAANVMTNLGKKNYSYVFGSPSDESVRQSLKYHADAVRIISRLKQTKIAAIGITPEGFGFGRAMDADVQRVFGSCLLSVEVRELLEKAKGYDMKDCSRYLEEFCHSCCGCEEIPKANMEGYARLMKAYVDFCTENNIGIIGSRCWPDLFTQFGTPNCAVLSMLNDKGISSACECDIYGAVSMFIASGFSGSSVFFGDPVSINEKENSITYWHCGMCAPSLASEPTVGVHPNRKIGPVMDFGCRASEKVTVFRIGRDENGKFRALVVKGSALDKEKQFYGTSVVVKTKCDVKHMVDSTIKNGWEPHYVVAYADISDGIEILCRFLNIPVTVFGD